MYDTYTITVYVRLELCDVSSGKICVSLYGEARLSFDSPSLLRLCITSQQYTLDIYCTVCTEAVAHKVYTLSTQRMSTRWNWDSPTPSLASECAPPPGTKVGRGGGHSPAGEGLGESQFRRLEKKLSTLPTLCYSSNKKSFFLIYR